MADETDQGRHPGRPSKFRPEFCERARAMCEAGAVDHEIAEALEISLTSLYVYKNQFPEFSHALKRGKAVADDAVEAALFRRATGYSHDAVKIMQYEGAPIEVPYVEHYAPDTTAAIFWLKNRRPADWRDKQDVNLGVQDSLGELLTFLDGRTRGIPGPR